MVSLKDEQLIEQFSQNQLDSTTQANHDMVLRAEFSSAQEHRTQMHTTRLATVRDNHASLQRLHRQVEEHGASLREIQVMVTRERDSYYEELVQSLPTPVMQTPVPAPACAPAPMTAGMPGVPPALPYQGSQPGSQSPSNGAITERLSDTEQH
eukprot:1978691-Amphidinium_carterae.2